MMATGSCWSSCWDTPSTMLRWGPAHESDLHECRLLKLAVLGLTFTCCLNPRGSWGTQGLRHSLLIDLHCAQAFVLSPLKCWQVVSSCSAPCLACCSVPCLTVCSVPCLTVCCLSHTLLSASCLTPCSASCFTSCSAPCLACCSISCLTVCSVACLTLCFASCLLGVATRARSGCCNKQHAP